MGVLGEVTFEGIHFRYPSRMEQPVFEGLNLHIPAHTSTALCGESGSGKSTIAMVSLHYILPFTSWRALTCTCWVSMVASGAIL